MRKLFLALFAVGLFATVVKAASGFEVMNVSSYSTTGSSIATTCDVYYIIVNSTGAGAGFNTRYLGDNDGQKLVFVLPTTAITPLTLDFSKTPITFKGNLGQYANGTSGANGNICIIYRRVGTK